MIFVAVPWVVFFAWWTVRGLQADKAVRVSRRFRWAPLVAAAAAVALFKLHPAPLWTPLMVPGVAVECVGIAFAIWAREHLGRIWSSRITLKQDHHLVQSGPYRIVRHPIYTGALFALAGLALATGLASVMVCVTGMAVDWWIKLRQEERLLIEHFGDEYREYQRKVPALIPRPW
jgi:protein-S-isoprenylcysteine O-methyltransferase Ste14